MNWTDRYWLVESKEGEVVLIDRKVSLGNYKRMARGFENYTKMNGYTYYKHVTLTQKKESYEPKFLNNFFMALKRRYGRVAYIWCAEVQEERLERTGESVLHYHIVIAFEYGTEFSREDILKIQSYWKYGNVDIKPVRNRKILNYIMKYISKSLETPLLCYRGLKVRKIGMTRIGQIYRHIKRHFCRILEWFDYDIDKIGKFFKVDKKGIYWNYWDEIFRSWHKDYALVVNRWRVLETFEEMPADPF
jgi:hypothetical protein